MRLDRSNFAVAAVAVAAFTAYCAIFLPYLYTAEGRVGTDFGYFLPQLLAGYFWYQNNGALSVPWFTPAFCGGIPFYPNMQGMYLSLPQFLSFAVGPVRAIQFTFVIFAGAGFAGFYALLRGAFRSGRWVALVGGVIFLFNGFYAYRFIIGHLTFHAFMLAPLIAVCVLAGRRPDGGHRVFDGWVAVAGLIIAYMVQSGMVHALPPTLMGVAVIMLAHALLFGPRWRSFARFALACAIALVLSAGKLAAALAFMAQYPRDMLPLIGFDNIGVTAAIAALSLFFAPAWPLGIDALRNNLWFEDINLFLLQHEFEFGVTAVPAVIILSGLAYGAARALRRAPRISLSRSRLAILVAIAGSLAVPILLNWYEPAWTGFLEQLPYFRNSMTMIRWFSMYVLLAALAAALVVGRLPATAAYHAPVAIGIIVSVVALVAMADRSYYRYHADYDGARVTAAYRAVANGAPAPAVRHLEWPPVARRDLVFNRHRNDGLTRGAAQVECYEPMFGHRLEEFPYGALREGPTLSARDGLLNTKNPACYVYPEANDCQPGDHFSVRQIAAARDFLAYRKFPFVMPWWQHAANWAGIAALIAMLAALAPALAAVRFGLGLKGKLS